MRSIFLILGALSLTLGLAACSATQEAGGTHSAVTEETPAKARTWLISFDESETGLVRLLPETGEVIQVSSQPAGVFGVSGDNLYQILDFSSLNVRVAALMGGTGFVIDLSELPEFEMGDSATDVRFAPHEAHTLQVVMSKADEATFQMWGFDIEHLDAKPKLLQEVAESDMPTSDLHFNNMDGSIQVSGSAMNPVLERHENEDDPESYVECYTEDGLCTDSEIKELIDGDALDWNLQEGGTGHGEAYPFGRFLSAASDLSTESDPSERGHNFETPDGVQWHFVIDGSHEAGYSLITFSRSNGRAEWKKYGKTAPGLPFDFLNDTDTSWIKPSI